MSLISIAGIIGIIFGTLQVLFPKGILKLKPLGVKTPEAVRQGGVITFIFGIVIILFDLLVLN
ncbi:hypothetical protein MUG84_22960 [Paenibacillus sp. KQZ6P-2]|uniref:Uncharacterized protein n=1 Tax=Paenibacillus mangrovi TaxID=2931978 RepID=A0A9X2B4F5_9BACL|nr:hypothetical protein [Paenibacillus mangrovi]MCJ8014564.1 hypothetical protein [Paenibacillus mangrovi]